MADNFDIFKWDADKTRAATLLAVGDLTNDQIAETLDIGIATLYNWKNHGEFKQEVLRLKAEIREEILYNEIADLVHRVRRYNKRWKQIDRLIDARAKEHREVPGGDTGLLVRDIKGKSENDVYFFDAALIREERELAKQVAQDTGQWTEKHEHGFAKLSDAELIAEAKVALAGVLEAGTIEAGNDLDVSAE